MEFSGDDDQVNSAGAYSTGSGLQQQQQEWSNQTSLPGDHTREFQISGVKQNVPSHHFEEQERSGVLARTC